MDTITLKYGFTALPALADRNGNEGGTGAGNWASHGNHTVTQSTDHAHGGTKAFKVVASGIGDATTNYVDIPSASNATFVVGKQYAATFWLYEENLGTKFDAHIKTGGVVSSAFSVSDYDTWARISCVFTASSATTDFQFYISQAATMYLDDLVFSECVVLNVLAEKGISDPDQVLLVPPIQDVYLDQSRKGKLKGFVRLGIVDVGVVAAKTDRLRILSWLIDNDRTLDYLTESDLAFDVREVGDNQGQFTNEWKFDCSLMRAFVFNLVERTMRTTWPN